MSELSNWGPVVVIVLGYVIGFYFQNRRIDDLRDAMNQRFNAVDARFVDMNARFADLNGRFADMNGKIDARFADVNARFADLNGKMDARFADMKDFIKSEVSRLEDRIERIEHPVHR